MEQDPSPATLTSRAHNSSEDRDMDFPVTGADPTSSIWDWGDLLELTTNDCFPISFDYYSLSPPPLEPPAAKPNTVPAADRVRKRDPRMTCSNFIAGQVPCAFLEFDAQLEKLEEEETGAPGKKRARTGRSGSVTYRCQVPGCEVDISELKGYHRRHRICLRCANSSTVLIDGETKRYCQQCGKFHLLSDFDEGKRSCRRKLERHNIRRRRKPAGSMTAVNKESRDAVQNGSNLSCQIIEEEPAFESEDGLVSAHCSAPALENIHNDSVVTLIDNETDGGKDDFKFSNSVSYSDSRLHTHPCALQAGSHSSFMIGIRQNSREDFGTNLHPSWLHYLDCVYFDAKEYVDEGNGSIKWLSENPMTYLHDFVFRPGRMLFGRGFMTIYLNNMILRTRKDGTSMVKIDAELQAPRLHYVHLSYFEAGKTMEFVACGSNLLHPKFQFLVSFAGRYLPNDYHVVSSHVHSKEGSPSCDHQLYKIYVPQTEPNLYGPAFIEVENQYGLSNFIPILIGDKEVCPEMKSIQQRFDASASRQGSKFSATGSFFESCEASTLRQRAYSELVLDIAWLLREPKLGIFQETKASSQIQRFNRLLSFLIQNKSTVILKKILQNLKIVVGKMGFNGANDSDIMLLQKYMDNARDILRDDELQKGEIPECRSEYIERERNQLSQSSFENDEPSVVSNFLRDMSDSGVVTVKEGWPLRREVESIRWGMIPFVVKFCVAACVHDSLRREVETASGPSVVKLSLLKLALELGNCLLTVSRPFAVKLSLCCLESNILRFEIQVSCIAPSPISSVVKLKLALKLTNCLLTVSCPFTVKLSLCCLESNILHCEVEIDSESCLLTISRPFAVKLNLCCLESNIIHCEVEIGTISSVVELKSWMCGYDILRRGVEIADGLFIVKLSLDLNIIRREVEIQVLNVAGRHDFLRCEVENIDDPFIVKFGFELDIIRREVEIYSRTNCVASSSISFVAKLKLALAKTYKVMHICDGCNALRYA
ncbi:Squamosa promoter-binding-like protein 8 [Hibiscus syriacus]|uniref:Squamosa promoter-binding-like protein 8 n=1 Tax=Hibiscus syriacus TaxID=106335 RepID=A0A6A3CZ51_HIBSY|nr:Squamosa promoter-binding-like protein 8 [Hibiscus syriacus]